MLDSITRFAGYCGKGMMTALFLLALVYLFFQEKNKNHRMIFLYMPVVTLLLYFCPLVSKLVYSFIGEDLYWRFLWLLPIVVVIAYTAVKIISTLQGKKQIAAGISLGLIVIMSGCFIYSSEHAFYAGNPYHLPQCVVDICEEIEPEEGKVRAAFPIELLPYVRQYSVRIEMPYGREYILLDWARRSELFYALDAETLDVERVTELARQDECDYLVFWKGKILNGDFKDYGFETVDIVGDYMIVRDVMEKK